MTNRIRQVLIDWPNWQSRVGVGHTHTRLFHHDQSTKGLKLFNVYSIIVVLLCYYFEYEYFGHVIYCFYYVNLEMPILMVILIVFQFFHEVIQVYN